MKTWLRRGLWAAVGVVSLGVGAVAVGLVLGERRAARHFDVAVSPVPLPDDADALARGRYLYASRGCAHCHGDDGGGRVFVNDAAAGVRLGGPNITAGSGGVVVGYRPQDWVRTIRHGVHPSGRPLRVMPSEDYNRMTDADLGAVVAHVRSLPPVAGGAAVLELPLVARVLYGFGKIPDAADEIDHDLPPSTPVPEGVTVEHGLYIVQMCKGCHGPDLAGGRLPGAPPDWPPAARLSPGEGNVMAARYADAQTFLRMLRSGRRPDGTPIGVMPFDVLGQMNDVDARALHLYLMAGMGR